MNRSMTCSTVLPCRGVCTPRSRVRTFVLDVPCTPRLGMRERGEPGEVTGRLPEFQRDFQRILELREGCWGKISIPEFMECS